MNGQPIASSFALVAGDNIFSFDPVWVDYPIDTIGLNLFFNETGVSFNPAYDAGVGIPGDLSAFTAAATGVFLVPVAGTAVQSFNTSGVSVIGLGLAGLGYQRKKSQAA